MRPSRGSGAHSRLPTEAPPAFYQSPGRLAALLLCSIAILLASGWLGGRRAHQEEALAATDLREMAPPGPQERILIFAPHPDDEVLGCAGLIQQALSRGAHVHVVLMTNGDGSELSLIFGERELSRKPRAFIDLGRSRQQETISALASLGLPADRIRFLGYPNNGLVALWRPDHWLPSSPYRSPYTRADSSPYQLAFTPDASYTGQQLLSDVIAVIEQVQPTSIYAPHPQDIHPDHWATSAFVSYGLATLGARDPAPWLQQTKLYGYLVHWPRFPSPRRLKPQLPLRPPSDIVVPRGAWLQLPLSAEQTRRKLAAVKLYRSQLPSLDRLLLDFVRANELFAALAPRTVQPKDAILWVDEDSRRRNLHGSDITELVLDFSPGSPVSAELSRTPRKLGKGAYISLDLRWWDSRGQPAIANVSIPRGGTPRALSLFGGELRTLDVSTRELGPGRLAIAGIAPPPNPHHGRGWFVTCWGSVRDRVTDPGVVARIVSQPSVPD
ncbi:MAG: PIG-L deacetylase family protein [Armatimonadota bacterium]